MAYEVTATRRRPQRFEDLVGQEFVTATLINAIQSGKIAHAYLFSGPRGCGKTSSARILAKALNCQKGPSGTPCGECDSCREISKGSCLDVIEIDGASNTGVNDVRQIKEEVLFPPNMCRYKIYIIDEVHMLSTSAFNALLKTIEEPPPYVIFIFATTELHKVPATIKSRCQQFNFKLGDIEKIKQLLSDTCRETGMTADDESLFWIARESTGSFRDAYTLFDQVAAFSDGNITFAKIQDKLGIVGLERINDIANACMNGDTGAVLSAADEILQAGVSLEQFISDLTDYFRSLLLLKSGITKESLLGHDPSRFSAAARECWTPIQLERAVALLLDVFRDIRYSLSPRYELDIALSRLSWLREYVSPAEVKRALDSARALLLSDKGAGRPFPDSSPNNPEAAVSAVQRTDFSGTSAAEAAGGITLKWKHKPHGAFAQIVNGYTEEEVPPQTVETSVTDVSNAADMADTAPRQMISNAAQRPYAAHQQVDTTPQPYTPRQTIYAEPLPAADVYQKPPVTLSQKPPDAETQQMETADSTKEVNPDIDADALRDSLIRTFSDDDNLLADKLATITGWRMNGTELVLQVDSAFLRADLEKKSPLIAQTARDITHASICVKVEVVQPQKAAEQPEAALPSDVTLVCNMFRGIVVKEHSEL